MKKIWERIKDAWYGALPILILLGIPTAICIVIGLINVWDDMPKIMNNISTLGNGSLIYGLILIIFGLIGAINALIAFYLWINALGKAVEKTAHPRFWFWFIFIATSFGLYALIEMSTKMP